MSKSDQPSRFETTLQRPAKDGGDPSWTFIVLPKEVSETLPRRGRTTIEGTINAAPFEVTLDPDGQLSHWMKVSNELQDAAGATAGDAVQVEIRPVEKEPEPEVPADFQEALDADAPARETWEKTTTIARLDWIHWITIAKQEKTRIKRIGDACDMLGKGKKRVCCFDPSGFYSKALSAPEAKS